MRIKNFIHDVLNSLWQMIVPYEDGLHTNHLIQFEAKHAPKWTKLPKTLKPKTVMLIRNSALIGIGGFLLLAVLVHGSSVINFVVLVWLVNFLLGMWLGLRVLTIAVDGINKGFITSRWDLLRLTPTNDDLLIYAEYVAIQLQAWRTACIVAGLRLSAVVALSIYFVLTTLTTNPPSSAIIPLFIIMLPLIVFVSLYLSLRDTFNHLKAVGAIVLKASTTGDKTSSANRNVWGRMIGFWLLQLIVYAIPLIIIANAIGLDAISILSGALIIPIFIPSLGQILLNFLLPIVLNLYFYHAVIGFNLQNMLAHLKADAGEVEAKVDIWEKV